MIAFVKGLGYNWCRMNPTKRTYNLQKRARAAEETRLRIIEAAHILFSESGYPNVSLDEIAAKAGVSRQTVYVQFRSKQGVLEALSDHIERSSFGTDADLDARFTALAKTYSERMQPTEDLLALLNEGFNRMMHFYGTNAPLLRNFRAEAAYDPFSRMMWVKGMGRHWRAMQMIIRTVDTMGVLATGWTIESAGDWLAAIAHFNEYDLLVGEHGWTHEQLVQRLLQLFRAMLLKSGD
jgi:AcrR family transcriptional regulator